MKKTLAALAISFFALNAQAGNTLAEKLSFPGNAKLLIIHADDLGMCRSLNEVSFHAMDAKIVTSGGLMVDGPYAATAVDYYRQHPEADLGVHLVFTSEWTSLPKRPITPVNLTKSLVNPSGEFWASAAEVAQHATLTDITREIEAQIQKALSFGLKPSHLDTHSGVMFTRPDFLAAYLKAAKKHHLMPLLPKLSPENEAMATAMGIPLKDLKPVWKKGEYQGQAVLDTLYLDEQTIGTEKRKEAYLQFLRGLKPGLSEILLDLADENSPEIKALLKSKVTGAEDVGPMFSDRDFFTDPATLETIRKLDIRLISWRDIQRVMKP
jgi:predicted glycoside hydrolase/deacetylase ChbG (UPF0249 family)